MSKKYTALVSIGLGKGKTVAPGEPVEGLSDKDAKSLLEKGFIQESETSKAKAAQKETSQEAGE